MLAVFPAAKAEIDFGQLTLPLEAAPFQNMIRQNMTRI
jgi:hypothetical protein